MLGEELRNARLAKGMTQEKLSHASGVDRTYISELEHDHKTPSVDVLFRICDALGIKASELIARVEEARANRRTKGKPKPPR